MWFTSDNGAPVHPAVMAALARANDGHAAAYGRDDSMAQVTAAVRAAFEAPDAAVYLVATGTAANALALACLCPPWATVYCHRQAHVEEDECAAPEFFTGGAKLTLLDGPDARIAPEALAAALDRAAPSGVHNVQKGALSITNVTERGAVLTPAEVAALAAIARSHGMPVHMDGARFANAVVAAGCTPAEMSWRAGVDVLSLGGTKNGLMGVEAVVFFDPAAAPGRAWEFELRRKRSGHLFSKHRYLAAQMEAWLADGLWLDLARAANARAADLAKGLARNGAVRMLHPAEANMVFAEWPRAVHRKARATGARYYYWPGDPAADGPDDEMIGARMVCSWDTGADEVAGLLSALGG
jgi:threonine aldolase